MRTASRLVVLVAFLGGFLRAAEPAKDDGSAEAFRQLGKLRAGLAFKAREEDHDPLRAAHLYLQAAQAFYLAHDDEYRKGLVAGTLAVGSLRATWMHPLRVVAMTFLPGDKQVVTCGADGSVRVWDALSGREVRSFQALDDSVQPGGKFADAAFSRDRSRLLLWGVFTVQVWDVTMGKLLRSWKPRPLPEMATFLPDGKRVLVWGRDPPARLLDVETGEELRRYDRGLAWRPPPLSPDGKRMLTWDPGGVHVWDVDAGELRLTLPGVGMDQRGYYAFTPDGRQVVAAGYADGSTRLYDAATGRQAQAFRPEAAEKGGGWLRDVRFSADGRRLLTHETNGKVRVWDRADGTLVATLATNSGGGARLSPDGKVVVVPGDRAVLWSLADEESTSLGRVFDAVFAPDGRRFLLIGPRAELWDAARKERLRTFGADSAGAAFNEDGSLLLVSSIAGPGMAGGTVRLWDLRQPEAARSTQEAQAPAQPLRSFRQGGEILAAVLGRDEKRLLTCGNGEEAFLWDTATGERLRSYRHGKGIRGAALGPDDARVLTWGEDGTLKLWDTKTGEDLHTLKNPAALRGALFGPDGKHILTWDVDYTARWWDPARPAALHKFEHDRELFGARLDPRGKQALTWGLDRAARVWNLDSGKLVRALTHPGPVFGAAFATEAGGVWTWSSDGIRLWDVKEGKELRMLPVEGGVPAAEPGRDDKHFLVQDGTGLVRYWDVATNKPLATFSQVFNVYGYSEALEAGVLSPDQSRALTWARDGWVFLWDLASGLKLKSFPAGTVRGAAFTRDGTRVLTWNANGTASLWDASFPRLLPPDEQLLALEVRTGVRVDEHGKLVGLSFEEWQDRRKKLEAVLKTGERGP